MGDSTPDPRWQSGSNRFPDLEVSMIHFSQVGSTSLVPMDKNQWDGAPTANAMPEAYLNSTVQCSVSHLTNPLLHELRPNINSPLARETNNPIDQVRASDYVREQAVRTTHGQTSLST
ncbi:MAG: hypothetical protein HETSPECPRED_007923 [Heterodermia speciosa]|uniref:Uncharacterized protein n=1 Tax=Heterodermia speciosa TaxID=116794 RepID=A0A8H3EM06_9LECA|nr:MAG: hypothetical protein HETSPECPRED_007923 [Heterodermia speciosa]